MCPDARHPENAAHDVEESPHLGSELDRSFTRSAFGSRFTGLLFRSGLDRVSGEVPESSQECIAARKYR